LFPLGALPVKDAVRARAVALGLSVADKPDSLDLCFIPDGDTQGFLTRRLGPQPGDIVDLDGAVLGRHDGTYRFTIGQRRGLALENPAPDGRPRYVVSLDPAARRVVVGPVEALDVTGLVTSTPVWYVPPAAHDCLVQVRAHATPVPGTVTPTDAGLTICLRAPLRGVAAGQSAVCYDGDRVLAQGAITSTARGEPPSRVD
jgi:tRNA-specific 2-thiouridylase